MDFLTYSFDVSSRVGHPVTKLVVFPEVLVLHVSPLSVLCYVYNELFLRLK